MALVSPMSILTGFRTFQFPFGIFWNEPHGGLLVGAFSAVATDRETASTTAIEKYLIMERFLLRHSTLRIDWYVYRVGSFQALRRVSNLAVNTEIVADVIQYQGVTTRGKRKIYIIGLDQNHRRVIDDRQDLHLISVAAHRPGSFDVTDFCSSSRIKGQGSADPRNHSDHGSIGSTVHQVASKYDELQMSIRERALARACN